jgi:hypothetical protein
MAVNLGASTLDQARAMKTKALTAFGHLPVVGVGITRIGNGYGLKINLESAPATGTTIPGDVEGVPVKVEVVGEIGKHNRKSNSI